MTIIEVMVILTLVGLLYATVGRRWLKNQPWAAKFFAWIEPIEQKLFKQSTTILFGRLLSLQAGFVGVYDTLALSAPSLDLTPITDRVLSGIPADMRGLAVAAAFWGIGMLVSWMRKRTVAPVEAPPQEPTETPVVNP